METREYAHFVCMIAEEEVQPEERQLALRPADMSFEQAMLHYMAQMNDRQGLCEGSNMTCFMAELLHKQRFCMMHSAVQQGFPDIHAFHECDV